MTCFFSTIFFLSHTENAIPTNIAYSGPTGGRQTHFVVSDTAKNNEKFVVSSEMRTRIFGFLNRRSTN